jgi:hypothetical protein
MHPSHPLVGHWTGAGARFGLAAGAVTGILLGGGVGIGIGIAIGAILGSAAGALADHPLASRRPLGGARGTASAVRCRVHVHDLSRLDLVEMSENGGAPRAAG